MNPDSLSPHWREFYEERAAMREHLANMPRAEAEEAAWQETQDAMRATNSERR